MMKAYRYINMLLSFFCFAAGVSCEVDDVQQSDGLVHKIFNATIEGGEMTKTLLAENSVEGVRGLLWDQGDEIGIGIHGSNFLKFTNLCTEVSSNGVFEGTINESNTYYAIYPWKENLKMMTELIVRIPSVQSYRANSFGKNMAPMVGRGNNGESIHFQNLCSILAISLKGSDKITKIVFTAKDAKGNPALISGDFSVDMGYEDFPYPMPTEQSLTSITINCDEGVQLECDKETIFNIILPPGTYNGFQVEMHTSDGGTITKSTTNKLSIARSSIKRTASLDFECPLLTVSVDEIEVTSAKFSGTITQKKAGYTYGFVYGKSPDITIETGMALSCTSDDFIAQTAGLSASTRYYVRSYCVTEFGTAYSSAVLFCTKHEINEAVVLHSEATANCYIALPTDGAVYAFDCNVKGNSEEPVGEIATVEVLWETRNTKENVFVGDIITNVTFDTRTILFQSTGVPGNALIAVKDPGGKILWSWHIWLCDYNPYDTANTYLSGAVMMDRNLGALNCGSDALSYGFLYQWGRKDPLLGSADGTTTFATTAPAINKEFVSVSNPVEYSFANPIHAVENLLNDNSAWGRTKTMYDPCPPGWRVPDGGPDGVWSGMVYGDPGIVKKERSWTINPPYSTPATIYPAPGYTGGDRLTLYFPGSALYCWSCDVKGTKDGYAMHLFDRIESELTGIKDSELSVRCMKE